MPSYNDKYFLRACKNLSHHPDIISGLRDEFGDKADEVLRYLRAQEPLPDKFDDVYTNILEFLHNEAPTVEEFSARESGGNYSVDIKGFRGAYFVHAGEYGKSEVFASLKAAEAYARGTYGEFMS